MADYTASEPRTTLPGRILVPAGYAPSYALVWKQDGGLAVVYLLDDGGAQTEVLALANDGSGATITGTLTASGAGTGTSLTLSSFLKLYGTSSLFTELLVNSSGNLAVSMSTVKPAAPTVALAGAGAGNVNNGTHVYCVTFITASGETDCSASSSAATVVDKTSDGKVTVTFTTSGFSGVTGRNIYRSKANTTTPLFLVATSPVVGNNSATTYTDNIADASLQTTVAPTSNTTNDNRLAVTNAGAFTITGSLTLTVVTGTPATFACFDSNGKLVSSATACA